MDPQTQNPPQVQIPVPNESQVPVTDVITQVVTAIQNGKNVLVTVGADPTVDELASALGLTFLLGKLDKHATAVFSGKIPPAMEFLDPEKIFENTVDSLRDFIIALDKEKADKLRYKVEDNVVKIFITPYRTVLSQKDLEFSQGDFNVDVVVALGVEKREELDKAIIAHGRILHDASVITINAGHKSSSLGSIDWNDPAASSAAEMLVGLSDAFGSDLLDSQISTAFLTGIVAETNRFSNEKTSPKVMSLSAQLMAAGANQQLIATNLRQEGMISEPVRKKEADQPHDDNGEMVLDHKPENLDKDEPNKSEVTTDSEIVKKTKSKKPVSPEKLETKDESNTLSNEGDAPDKDKEPAEQLKDALATAAKPDNSQSKQEDAASEVTQTAAEEVSATATQPKSEPEIRQPKVVQPLPSLADEPVASTSLPPITPLETHKPTDKPTFGGTLNATTAGAEDDQQAQAERETEVNNVALSHDSEVTATDTNAKGEAEALDAARQAVEDANVAQPFSPANQPLQSIGSEPLSSIEPATSVDTSVSQMQSSATAVPPASEPEPNPVDAFMQPHDTPAAGDLPALNAPTPTTPVLPPLPDAPTSDADLPPLPPLPGAPASDGAMPPPLPPLPGQPGSDPAAAFQPQINPSFMQNMPQSQNTWTQAGDDLAASQANKDAVRQQKMDQMTQQYDQAVDRNREMQGLPPLNNPNGSGLPPLPPLNP